MIRIGIREHRETSDPSGFLEEVESDLWLEAYVESNDVEKRWRESTGKWRRSMVHKETESISTLL